MKPKIVFMGSAEFALPILEKLVEQYEIQGVITQPDRPAGRGKTLTPPPVKTLAQKLDLFILQPTKLLEPAAFNQLKVWQPDLIVVAAFGQILRPPVLQLPRYGCLNVHASLLPRWRGAAPIAAAILHGDQQTGVTIMQMDEGIDTGPILRQKPIPIFDQDTTQTLTKRLAREGADLLIETIPDYLSGKCKPIPQDDSQATYAAMIKKEDGFLDFNETAVQLWRKIRAYNPWPCAYTLLNQQRLIILEAIVHQGKPETSVPGQTFILDKKPMIATRDNALELLTIQLAGRKPLSGKQFLNGYPQWGKIKLPT
ncbi:MAG: methionyl-tRNA formyltransferase [Anaerolineales bacterium]